MAGMFYSQKEAAEKLNMTEEQISKLVEQGKLREFRDGANLLFKVDEVEALVGETGETAVEPSAGDQEEVLEEVSLESAEDTSALEPVFLEEDTPIAEDAAAEEPLVVEEESLLAEDTSVQEPVSLEEEMPLVTEEAEPEMTEPPSLEASGDEMALSGVSDEGTVVGGELTNADTAITREGINVLDGTGTGYDVADDTMSETQAMQAAESLEEIEEDVNLDTFGSGSGLLDLSLQADDTSLGGILDEIYTPDEQQGEVVAGESASAEAVVAEADMLTTDEGLDTVQYAAVVRGYVEPETDSSSNLFGIMLFLPLLVVIYTAIVTASGLFHFMPTILEQTRGFILYVLGGLIVVALVLMTMGFMAAKPATGAKPKARKEKPPKVKKEKPPKPKKEKKPKEEKKPKKKK